MTSQVAIDWDYIPEDIPGAVKTRVRAIPYWYPVTGAKYRVSSSGTGIHVVLDIGAEISDIDSLFIRAVMNDDYKRLRLDMIRYLYAQREIGLIFSEKVYFCTGEKKKSGEWEKCL